MDDRTTPRMSCGSLTSSSGMKPTKNLVASTPWSTQSSIMPREASAISALSSMACHIAFALLECIRPTKNGSSGSATNSSQGMGHWFTAIS